MARSPATVMKRSPFLFRLAGLSSNPISHSCRRIRIPGCPVESLGCFSRHSYQSISKPWHCLETGGFGRLGLNDFRALAVSGGGSGGIGGLGGSGGGGNGRDGDGGGGGGSKWSLLSWYLTLIEKYPVWTKAITSALLNLMGDLMCQIVIDQVQSPDLKRTFLFTMLGLVLVGPTLHFWYFSLSKLVTLPGAAGAFLRLLLDQFLFSPIFIGVFLATLITLEGRPSEVVPKLQQEWFSSVVANWQLWIPFQFLNFRFVPQQFQVLAANFIALIWNVILSFKAHKEVLPK